MNNTFLKKLFKIFRKKINIQNFKEVSTSRPAPGVCKWNKIINFFLFVKLGEEIGFLQGPLKTYIFYANRFLYDLLKKSKTKTSCIIVIHIFCLLGFFLK